VQGGGVCGTKSAVTVVLFLDAGYRPFHAN
jgi:hypothetical protein